MRYSHPSVLSDLKDFSLASVALQLVIVEPAKSTRVIFAVFLTQALVLLISKTLSLQSTQTTLQKARPGNHSAYRIFMSGLEKGTKAMAMTKEKSHTLVISYFST